MTSAEQPERRESDIAGEVNLILYKDGTFRLRGVTRSDAPGLFRILADGIEDALSRDACVELPNSPADLSDG